MSQIYFDTLAATVDGAVLAAGDRGVMLARPTEVWALCQDHLAYDTTRTGDFEISTLKGRPTKKYFHVVICRLDSGRYELTTYIL